MKTRTNILLNLFRKFSLAVLLVAPVRAAHASATGTFTITYQLQNTNLTLNSYPAIYTTPDDNGYYVVGTYDDSSSNQYPWILKLNMVGGVDWSVVADDTNLNTALTPVEDGGLIVEHYDPDLDKTEISKYHPAASNAPVWSLEMDGDQLYTWNLDFDGDGFYAVANVSNRVQVARYSDASGWVWTKELITQRASTQNPRPLGLVEQPASFVLMERWGRYLAVFWETPSLISTNRVNNIALFNCGGVVAHYSSWDIPSDYSFILGQYGVRLGENRVYSEGLNGNIFVIFALDRQLLNLRSVVIQGFSAILHTKTDGNTGYAVATAQVGTPGENNLLLLQFDALLQSFTLYQFYFASGDTSRNSITQFGFPWPGQLSLFGYTQSLIDSHLTEYFANLNTSDWSQWFVHSNPPPNYQIKVGTINIDRESPIRDFYMLKNANALQVDFLNDRGAMQDALENQPTTAFNKTKSTPTFSSTTYSPTSNQLGPQDNKSTWMQIVRPWNQTRLAWSALLWQSKISNYTPPSQPPPMATITQNSGRTATLKATASENTMCYWFKSKHLGGDMSRWELINGRYVSQGDTYQVTVPENRRMGIYSFGPLQP